MDSFVSCDEMERSLLFVDDEEASKELEEFFKELVSLSANIEKL
jgi:hypothetical protein